MHKTKIIFIGIICLMPKKIIFSLLVFILLIGGVLSYLNKNKILSYENTDLIAEKTSEKNLHRF
jgi:nitrate/TMAO reductase-like tetraheme cytochrome c subunit